MPGSFNDPHFRKLLLALPEQAIKILYHEYFTSLMRIAINFTHDAEVAEEIVQDTFIHVWENSKRLAQRHEKSIQHYLVRVVRNKSVSYYKNSLYISKQKIKYLNGRTRKFDDSPEAQLIQHEMTEQIRDFIASFPPREHQCLIMKIDQELDNREISQRLGVSVKAVERSITSAKKRLRTHLQMRE